MKAAVRQLMRVFPPLFLVLFLSFAMFPSQAQRAYQRTYPGRGRVSSQDFAKLTAPAATGSDAADQVCARYAPGSVVSDPPTLVSENGVLEVTMKFLTVVEDYFVAGPVACFLQTPA